MRSSVPQLLVLAVLLCCFLRGAATTARGTVEVGFQPDAQRAYASLYYESTFYNLVHSQMSTLFTYVSSPSSESTSQLLTENASGAQGCVGSPVCTGVLVLLRASPTAPWYVCVTSADMDESQKAYCLLSAMKDVAVPLGTLSESPHQIGLVLDTDTTSAESARLRETSLDYSQVVVALAAYNSYAQREKGVMVTSLLTSSRGWIPARRVPRAPLTNVSLAFFDVSATNAAGKAAEAQWSGVVSHAAFNMRRWSLGYTYPMYLVEVRNPAPRLASLVGSPHACFTADGADPACVPAGGWSVWAALNANTSWQWLAATKQFVRTTPAGATALFVPTTIPSLTQSGYEPDLVGPASAIVTALVAINAVRRLSETLGISPALYVFFVPGESVGNVGSGRLLYDAAFPPSCAAVGPDACRTLLYDDHLNFTTLDFSAVDRAVVVDHLHYDAGSPQDADAILCFHLDERVDDSGGNRKVVQDTAVLAKVRVRRTNKTAVEWSPTRTYTQFIDRSRLGNVSALTISSLCDRGARVSSSVAADASVRDRIRKAALAIAQLLLADAHCGASETVKLLSSVVDTSLIDTLFDCFSRDFACPFLSPQRTEVPEKIAPDYAFGAFRSPEVDDGDALTTALTAALIALELQPLTSPAVPARLEMPLRSNAPLLWSWKEDWPLAPSPLDSVWVESVVSCERGVRLTTVTSPRDSVAAFFLGLSSVAIVSALLFCHMAR